MDLFKIKDSTDGKIYRLVDDYDVTLQTSHFETGVNIKMETHYVLQNIENEDDIITVPISDTLLHG